MKNLELINQATELAVRDFDLTDDANSLSLDNPEMYEALKKKLVEKISGLISTNMEKLYSLLYRIDVDEEKVKEEISKRSPDEAPEVIAVMIIEREIEKAITRKKYGNKPEDWKDE